MERYRNFWRRLGAAIFDGLILLPIPHFIIKYADLTSPGSYLAWTTVEVFCYILYSILLTGLAGQTIGKIVMGLKVLDIDEKRFIGIKRAFYRDSVPFTLQILALFFLGYRLFITKSVSTEFIDIVEVVIGTASFGWFVAELLTMFFNRRRRALHDLLASSVVISLKGQRIDEHYEKLEARREATK